MNNLGHDRRIGDSQILDAVHLKLVIHYRPRIIDRAHFARPRLVILGSGVLHNGTVPVLVAGVRKSRARWNRRIRQAYVVSAQHGCVRQGKRDAYSLDQNGHIQWIGQIVLLDYWIHEWIGARQAYRA